jgi:hypothetical protein
MPQEIKQLIGAMNLDDPNEVIGKAFHKTARNIRFKGAMPNLRPEVVPGNIKLVNEYLPEDGINLTIGREYDAVNKRIFFFNYNSEGKHGIYIFNTLTGIFQRLLEVGVLMDGDVLGFTPTVIYNIDILYGDSTQGDILYYIDTLGRPTKININRALSGGYGIIRRTFIDVAKEPADIPPYVVYEDDASVTVNALRKKLFKIKIRWVFDDNEKSVTSSQSEVPLPYDAFNTSTDSDPTKNCRIAVVYQTGPSNVKKVEILAALSLGNVFSDYFLIASIDKDAEGVPSNDIDTYLFYNDKAYTYIPTDESIQLQDYVPQVATAQALLNGNVLGYGNITEGYANLTNFSNGTDTSAIAVGTSPYFYGRYFSLLVATQRGTSGFGSGNIHIIVRGRVTAGNNYQIFFEDGTTVAYVATGGDDASAVIEGLRVDALSEGFTIVQVGTNDLYISKTDAVLARFLLQPFVNVTTGENVQNQSLFAYDWWSKHGWGLTYFDEKGRSNGTVYTDGFSVDSLPYDESNPPVSIPRYVASIYHRPPSWATYYQWVRTKDLTKSKIIQWISDRTLKDTNTGLGVDAYAYISIENLNTFVSKNSGSPLSYGFTPNDRIRFIKLLDGSGSTIQIYSQRDYEIAAAVVNPTVNGVDYTGHFVKIILPSTDGTFDFGSSNFANYFIELYTPAQSVANDLNLYFEYGERYAIGNPGTSEAFHQGQLQNQTEDLVTPATFQFTKGDYYIRRRTIQTGQEIVYSITSGFGPDPDAGRITLGLTPISVSYSDPNITPGDSPFNNLIGFNLGSDTNRSILTIGTGTYTFRIKGTIIIIFRDVGPDSYPYEFFLQKNNGTKYQLVAPFDAHNPGTYTFQVDTTFTMNSGERLFIFGWAVNGNDNTRSFATTNLTITREAAFTQYCIDPNYSDYFPSAVNSNGRAWVYDPNANRVNFPVMMRWGGIYQEDTNINNTNRFYPENFASYNRSQGPIKAFGVYENMLTIFQERRTAVTGIYSKYIQNNENASELITTNTIITPNNYQYYAGNFGVGNQPDSIVQSGFVYYHVDPIKGKILRLSRDGYSDLGELYKVQTWAGDNIPKYLNDLPYQYGGNARITGAFNIYPDKTGEYLLVAQAGSSESISMMGEILSFDEAKNSFTSFHDYAPECIICAENVLYCWQNGEMWKEDQLATPASFCGAKRTASITLVFNENAAIKKVFNAIAYQSNRDWYAASKGDVETSSINYETGLPQQSLIMTNDIDVLEMPYRYAAFNKDMNSKSDQWEALWEGDELCGTYIVVKLSYGNAADSYLFAPYIVYQIDQRNF